MSDWELKNTDASTPAGGAPAANGKPIAYKRCAPGEGIPDSRPGDIVLVRGARRLGKSIHFGATATMALARSRTSTAQPSNPISFLNIFTTETEPIRD
jgi:hypothetical protein